MTTEALRLAKELERVARVNCDSDYYWHEAAAELRRLDAENKLLRLTLPEVDGVSYEPAPCVWDSKCTGCAAEENVSLCEQLPDACNPFDGDATRYIWLKVTPVTPAASGAQPVKD